jgi:copper(I)-binding protein
VNRALRAATTGVLLLFPIALSACSSGQVTQTVTQNRDKTGAMAEVKGITLRAVTLEYPRGGAYEAGDDAELRMAIVNDGTETDTLTSVEGDGFSSAEIIGARAEGATSAPDQIEIPAGESVFVGEDDVKVNLIGLSEGITTGQTLPVVLTFEKAGDITVDVPVANPERAQERGDGFDFHESNGAASGGENGAG